MRRNGGTWKAGINESSIHGLLVSLFVTNGLWNIRNRLMRKTSLTLSWKKIQMNACQSIRRLNTNGSRFIMPTKKRWIIWTRLMKMLTSLSHTRSYKSWSILIILSLIAVLEAENHLSRYSKSFRRLKLSIMLRVQKSLLKGSTQIASSNYLVWTKIQWVSFQNHLWPWWDGAVDTWREKISLSSSILFFKSLFQLREDASTFLLLTMLMMTNRKVSWLRMGTLVTLIQPNEQANKEWGPPKASKISSMKLVSRLIVLVLATPMHKEI